MNPYYNPELISSIKRQPSTDYFKMQNPNIQMPAQFGVQQSGQPAYASTGNFFQNNQWASQDSSGVGQIGTMATQMLPAEQGRFDIDPNAGFKGSFAGLGQGGVIGAIAGGIGAQAATFSKVNKNLAALDRNVSAYTNDAFGNPIYQGGEVIQAQKTADELKSAQGKINKSIDPATRVFSGLYGTKKKLRRAQRDMKLGVENAQKSYNKAEAQSVNKRNIAEEFYDRNNKSARMANLYRVPTSFSQLY